jgi:hypothetical protein
MFLRMVSKRITWIIVGLIAFALVWSYDPNTWRIRSRFPTAKVTDCYDYGLLVPAFLHAAWIPRNDLYEGYYLEIQISGTTVDLRQFHDIPFFLISLDHCKVTNLPSPPLTYESHRDVLFHDCDFSGLPASELTALTFPKDSTPSQASGDLVPQ